MLVTDRHFTSTRECKSIQLGASSPSAPLADRSCCEGRRRSSRKAGEVSLAERLLLWYSTATLSRWIGWTTCPAPFQRAVQSSLGAPSLVAERASSSSKRLRHTTVNEQFGLP